MSIARQQPGHICADRWF